MLRKKRFLYDSFLLYEYLLDTTENTCLKKFIAFRMVITYMAFEELINERSEPDLRRVRDRYFAHRQEGKFFGAFAASELVTHEAVLRLKQKMEEKVDLNAASSRFSELTDSDQLAEVKEVARLSLAAFEKKFYQRGVQGRNFLCTLAKHPTDISDNPVTEIARRYNSAKDLAIMANYLIQDFHDKTHLMMLNRCLKADYILHVVNMVDSIFKDRGQYSIDGLYESLQKDSFGAPIQLLENLKSDTDFWQKYEKLREVRNKAIGHLDRQKPLEEILQLIDDLDLEDAFEVHNRLDQTIRLLVKDSVPLSVQFNRSTKPMANAVEFKGISNTF